jgi:RNA polymerase sigma factor (TIGR02999 family)
VVRVSSNTGNLTQALREIATLAEPSRSIALQPAMKELRVIAASQMRNQPVHHTLQVTALVHEAVLKILHAGSYNWASRNHFYATAALAMRQILISSAARRRTRAHTAEERAALDRLLRPYEANVGDLEALEAALRRLAEFNPIGSRLVELKFFLGLPMSEVADVLDIPLRSVEYEWTAVRGWLFKELSRDA